MVSFIVSPSHLKTFRNTPIHPQTQQLFVWKQVSAVETIRLLATDWRFHLRLAARYALPFWLNTPIPPLSHHQSGGGGGGLSGRLTLQDHRWKLFVSFSSHFADQGESFFSLDYLYSFFGFVKTNILDRGYIQQHTNNGPRGRQKILFSHI